MRRAAIAATAFCLTVATLLGTAAPADAGQWTDPTSWGNGTTIGVANTSTGNVVGLWQLFLSTRYRAPGQPYTPSFTGTFDATTANYTKFWQAEHSAAGLTVDGVVGPATWSAARFFHVGSSPYQANGWKYFVYVDTNGTPGQVPIPWNQYYATWFFRACPNNINDQTGTKLVSWTAIDLPASAC